MLDQIDVATVQAADCRVSVVAPGHLLSISGRLDVHAAADVRLALTAAIPLGAGDLVVQVSRVDAVDATGLGVLVGCHRRAGRAGRVLVLQDPAPPLARALRITRLDRVLRTSRGDLPRVAEV